MTANEFQRCRSCTGKRKYPDRESAEDIAKAQAKKWRLPETVKLNVYLCRFCRSFHIGREQVG